jgi:hypothetical protein
MNAHDATARYVLKHLPQAVRGGLAQCSPVAELLVVMYGWR